MKAVVFAAGIGSRLKPFTNYHPKALAEIAGKPILGHVLDKLIESGVDDIVVNIHHFPEQIIEYLVKNYPLVRVSDESSLLLDTAGGLAKIFRENGFSSPLTKSEPIIVHNADIYTDFDLAEMLTCYNEDSATILVDSRRKSSREILFDSKRMVGWINLKTGELRPEFIRPEVYCGAAFGGVHIISGSVLSKINTYVGTNLRPSSIIDFYIDSCTSIDIIPYTPSKPYKWFDIGSPEKLSITRQCVEN